MEIGINMTSFTKRGHGLRYGEKAYEKLKKQGFSYIDFAVATLAEQNLTSDEAEKIILREKELISAAGLRVSQTHGPGHNIVTDKSPEGRSARLEVMKKALYYCSLLDCEYMVVHPIMPLGWSDRKMEDNQATFDINVEYYKELLKEAKKYGITLCYENLPCIDFSISTPQEIFEVVRTINDENFKCCLDTGHVVAFDPDAKVEDAVRLLGDNIKVLHCHDNYGRSDQHAFPQFGIINWKEVSKALSEIDFKGVFSLELEFPDGLSDELFDESFCLLSRIAKEIVTEN